MRLIVFLAGLCLAAACAPVDTTPTPKAPPSAELSLHQDAGDPAAIDTAFKAEIDARYAGDIGLESTTTDLVSQGFLCRSLGSYPAIQPGGVLTVCELPRPHGLCSDMWTVDLKLKVVSRKISFERVAAEGRFARTCVAGASPN